MKYLIIQTDGPNGAATIAIVDAGVEPMPNVGDSIAIGQERFEVTQRHWAITPAESENAQFGLHHQHSANLYVRKC